MILKPYLCRWYIQHIMPNEYDSYFVHCTAYWIASNTTAVELKRCCHHGDGVTSLLGPAVETSSFWRPNQVSTFIQTLPMYAIFTFGKFQRNVNFCANWNSVYVMIYVWYEICALLGYYAASCGNCLPTFRDNVSVPSSRVKSQE
jgi:hypothetical protein